MPTAWRPCRRCRTVMRQMASAATAMPRSARLVLSLSVLTDTDLAAIAVSQSQQHLVAIAERARLSESVTDILVERGDQKILHTVSANEGANFSDRGFDRLLERGRTTQRSPAHWPAAPTSPRTGSSACRDRRTLRRRRNRRRERSGGKRSRSPARRASSGSRSSSCCRSLGEGARGRRRAGHAGRRGPGYHLAQVLAQIADIRDRAGTARADAARRERHRRHLPLARHRHHGLPRHPAATGAAAISPRATSTTTSTPMPSSTSPPPSGPCASSSARTKIA